MQARNGLGEEFAGNPDIGFVIPKEGGMIWMDNMTILKDSPNAYTAHVFMNYIMRPEVHAGLTNKVFYANPNLASRKLIKPEVANDPAVYPPEAAMARMAQPEPLNNDIRRQMTRIYTSFKTGL